MTDIIHTTELWKYLEPLQEESKKLIEDCDKLVFLYDQLIREKIEPILKDRAEAFQLYSNIKEEIKNLIDKKTDTDYDAKQMVYFMRNMNREIIPRLSEYLKAILAKCKHLKV